MTSIIVLDLFSAAVAFIWQCASVFWGVRETIFTFAGMFLTTARSRGWGLAICGRCFHAVSTNLVAVSPQKSRVASAGFLLPAAALSYVDSAASLD
jgi:hypothetical protein